MQAQSKHKYFYALACVVVCLLSFGCYQAAGQEVMYSEEGMASFYASKFSGRRTTSGEIYSGKKLTAAHRTLPLGTKVKVTNLKTKRWVIVTINDRGPRPKSRLIDLSRRAARHLGMLNGSGVVKVRVEQIPLIPAPTDKFRRDEAQ